MCKNFSTVQMFIAKLHMHIFYFVSCFCRTSFSSPSNNILCSFISPSPVYPPVLPDLVGFAPLGWAQNQMVLKGLGVLTGTVSDLCFSGHELPLVLQKTSGPVVHVCLCWAQLTFGIPAFQFAAHGTSCLPPVLDDAMKPLYHVCSYMCVCVCVQKQTHTMCRKLFQTKLCVCLFGGHTYKNH